MGILNDEEEKKEILESKIRFHSKEEKSEKIEILI